MKLSKRIFTVLLSVLLLLLPLQATAAASQPCPIIYVHGFMSQSILADKNDPNSAVLFPPDVNSILSIVAKALPGIAGALALQNWETLGDRLSDAAESILSPVFLSDTGTVPNNSGVYYVYPKAETINKNSTLDFFYDWRCDPMEIAAELNDFVNYVCAAAGTEQVSISAHSLGGVITLTYLTLYGFEKVRAVCFNASAVFGETYNGELMNGKVEFHGAAFDSFLRFALDGTDAEALLNGLMDLLKKAGIFDIVASLGNKLVEKELDAIAPRVLLPLFANWLTIWSMIPDDAIDGAMDYVFGGYYKGEQYAALREKVETYNRLVRAKKAETLQALNEHASVYVLSRYGYSSIPLTPSYQSLGDGNIDAKYSSFGATTAPFGKQLPAAYLETVAPAYISPDKTIDASTCMFPQQTWFIRNMKHSRSAPSIRTFITTLLNYDGQATVETFAEYPRFLQYDEKTDTLLPDAAAPAPTILEKLRAMWNELVALLRRLFAKIKTT